MSEDPLDDFTSETFVPPKAPPPNAKVSWWLEHQTRDGFTKRAEAEIPRMSATKEVVNGNFIVGHVG